MGSQFYIHSPSTSTSSLPRLDTTATSRPFSASSSPGSDSDDTSLPFPAPLPRADFLDAAFSPPAYLSNLAATRYQTLEDLRAELRARTQLLNQELLDLVNSHHEDFIGLGRSLKGGEEKVDEVRVGVLGFRREVEDVRRKVVEREEEVTVLLEERRAIRGGIETARRLLEFEERLARLEERLMVGGIPAGGAEREGVADDEGASDVSEEDEDDDEEETQDGGSRSADDGPPIVPLSKLTRRVRDLKSLEKAMDHIGAEHPFIQAQKARVTAVRDALLLDLGNSLKQASKATSGTAAPKMELLTLYRDIDAGKEAVKVLKDLR